LSVAGKVGAGPGDAHPDQSRWQQCPNQLINHPFDSTLFPDGSVPVRISASNAAGVSSTAAGRLWVDNRIPTLTLSGPHDALATAGTQYLTATAAAGPSGVSSIVCSLDRSPFHAYSSSSVRIGVKGLGPHHLSCFARNGAISASGQPGSSALESWTLTIRQPSVSTLSFARAADKIHCVKTHKRIHIRPHWSVERVHGHSVRVKVPGQTRRIKVTKCHSRHPKSRIHPSSKRARFGSRTRISGWLGTAGGVALGGQRVAIMTAPANGNQAFTVAATVTTAPNGTWTARLPPGPSRLIHAVYRGSGTVEPTSSATGHLIVPAAISIHISPRRTHWGGTISIGGRLRGGYVPTSGELVVLWISWHGGSTEIGHLYAHRSGRFHTPYTFLRGNGTVTYRIWAASARESDYPYAPSRSRRLAVTVRR
jgi:hypothetical protein